MVDDVMSFSNGVLLFPEEYHSLHAACYELFKQIEEFIVGKQ